jgi:hypothetical protein
MPIPEETPNASAYNSFGSTPDVSEKSLKAEDRVVNSTSQAYQVANTIIYDSREIVRKAAKITAKINGAPPRSRRELKDQAKAWQSNVSTGALATTIAKIPPRLWQPIKTARYLVANSLPEGTPNGNHKTEYFRRIVTQAIRSWKKWPFTVQTLANEVSRYGFAFPTFFDKYDWRPNVLRMDRGFVPAGAEIMDDALGFFVVKWDYKPGDLLSILKKSEDAGLSDWDRDNTVAAINNATTPDRTTFLENSRSYEDMIRQGTAWLSFTKGVRVVQTVHLFVQENDGKVSYYILLDNENGGADGVGVRGSSPSSEENSGNGLLYSKLDAFDSIHDVTIPIAFEFGNGTIHGSQGAGHILYDMSVQLELSRNESFDNLKMSNRLKLQVPDAKDVNQVKTIVQDTQIIVSGAQFAGVQAALPTNVEGYISLDQQMSRLMEEKVGAFLPSYTAQNNDKTATQAQIDAAKEQEIRDAILDNWLTQFAMVTHAMMRRLTDKESEDDTAKDVREKLLEVLDDDEIEELRDSPPNQSIIEFTGLIGDRKAAFAQSVRGNPYYDQFQVEQLIAEQAVGQEVASVILPPGEDENKVAEATRQQIIELTSLSQGAPIPVVKTDSHYVHMNTMKPWMSATLQQATQGDMSKIQGLTAALQHYDQHYNLGVEQKVIPKDAINEEKGLIAQWGKALESLQQRQQAEQKMAAIQAGQKAVADGGPEQAIRALEATNPQANNPPATNEQPSPIPGINPGSA